jgi:enoyl-CoA hydratase
MTQVLVTERRGSVEVLTLNRPQKLNALSVELIDALMAALDEAELDDAVGAVVLTGAGRAFSAGADIAGFAPHIRAGTQQAIAHFMRPGQRLTRRIEAFAKPVLAAVNGLAYGGGCEIVEAAHLALAADTAVFAKAEIDIGIIPTFGGTQRLPRNVGRKRAIELILTGRPFTAEQALAWGLLNRVVGAHDLRADSVALAEDLASKPRTTVAAALAAVHRGMDASIDDGLAIEEAAFARIVPTADAAEGVAAFLEKRAPRYTGR